MIVRILGEGQFDVADGELDHLNSLDDALERAVATGDEEAFRVALTELLGHVRAVGTPVPAAHLGPSAVVLPSGQASLAEVRELLGDEGLVPG